MKNFIKSALMDEGIDLCVFLPLDRCTVTKQYLLDKAGISHGFAVVLAIPYYTHACDNERNISAYAVSRDYHHFVNLLSGKLIPKISEKFKNIKIAMFADHSPIDEREAALKGGLGIMGRNNLLITEKYSSYVFLAELIVGEELEDGEYDLCEPRYCENCGACTRACPWKKGECDECLSAITQKKGELDEKQISLLKKYSLWGCDICTEICPYTLRAKKSGSIYSQIEFFNQDTIALITHDTIAKMSDDEFSKRAFSWRGRDTILRNADIGEQDN